MSELMKVHDTVYEQANAMSDEHGITMKEAVRQMCREGGYDV